MGHSSPHFRPMSIVAMQTAGQRYTRRCVRLPLHGMWHSSPLCSGTIAHLSCCWTFVVIYHLVSMMQFFPENTAFNFWATVCKTVRPMLSDRCLSCLSVTLAHSGKTVGRIELGTQVGLGHIVSDGDPASPPQGAQPPVFGPYLLWSDDWMD